MPALNVQASIDIHADRQRILAALTDFNIWPIWSPWLYLEPEAQLEFDGTPGELGHGYRWQGAKVGSGEMKLQHLAADRVDCDLEFQKPFKSRASVGFELEPVGKEATRVSWTMKSSLPFFMFFMTRRMSAMVQIDYERGLKLLKDYLELGSVPSRCDVEGESSVKPKPYVAVKRDTNMANLSQSMEEAFAQVEKSAERATLSISGAPFAIYHRMDPMRGSVSYSAALPLEFAPTDAPDGVELAERPGGRCYRLLHTGAYRHLPNAWSRAFADLRAAKLKAGGPPWEEYLNDPRDIPEHELMTTICIPLR